MTIKVGDIITSGDCHGYHKVILITHTPRTLYDYNNFPYRSDTQVHFRELCTYDGTLKKNPRTFSSDIAMCTKVRARDFDTYINQHKQIIDNFIRLKVLVEAGK